jgi:hypothetical protein
MTLEFEENVLRYLVIPENKPAKFLKLLDDRIFDITEHQIILTLLKGFVEEYKTTPKKPDFLEYATRQIDKNGLEADIRKPILRFIKSDLYCPVEASNKFIKETLIEYCQYKLTRNLFKDFSDRLKDGAAVFKELKKQMSDIVSMSDQEVSLIYQRGGNIFENGGVSSKTLSKVLYTPYEGLNFTMGAKGFCAPELVVIMSGSKSFKTGFNINMAVGFARMGHKVYYADGENGYRSISTRTRQCFCECTKSEVVNDEFSDPSVNCSVSEMFDRISKEVTKFGGAFVIDSFAPSTATVSDVEDCLETYRAESGFVPDIIFWDSIEHFNPSKETNADYLNSQRVVKDVIGLNIKLNCVSITPAQVDRNAIGKDIYSIKDIGRDYGVIRFAHTVLSIIRNPDEEEAGLAHLYSVVQREGKSKVGCCMLKLEEDIMQAKEISYKEAGEILGNREAYSHDNIRKNKKQFASSVKRLKVNASKLVEDNELEKL